jgi:hypothetical protein
VALFLALDARDSPADFVRVAIVPSRSVYGLEASALDSPFERLAFSLSGRQFQQRMFAGADVVERNLDVLIGNLGGEFAPLSLLLALAGAVAMAWHERRLAVLLLGSLALQLAYVLQYDIGDIYVFFISSYVLVALLVARGAAWLENVVSRGQRVAWRQWSAGLGAGLVMAAAIGPVASDRWPALRDGRVPTFPFKPYPVGDGLAQEHMRIRLVVARLEQGALLFAEWRRLYPYYYVAHLESDRTDLRFAELKPHRVGESDERSMIAYVRGQATERVVYLEHCPPELTDAGLVCWPVPAGVDTLYRVRLARGP